MLRTALRRYGIFRTTIGLTCISILLSLPLSYGMHELLGDGAMGTGIWIAIIAPAVITPLMAVHSLRLLQQLDQAEQRLQLLSNIDELTQAYNRRYFIQFGEQELKRAQRYGESFAIAIIDLDNFKTINDQHGHLVGDQVLYAFSQICKSSVRQADVFARYGGDEFIFLFPRTDREEAHDCASRVFQEVSSTPIPLEGGEIQILLSMGVALFDPQQKSLDELLAEADRALYRAKKNGGNQSIFSFDE
jgi:diguanylate cyclase (GGDEF)-like protein